MTYPETLGEVILETMMKAPPEKTLRRYKVLICPKCKTGQMTDAEKSCSCKKCGASIKIRPNVYLLDFDDEREAVDRTSELKTVLAEVRFTNDNNKVSRFFNKWRRKT